MVPLMSEPKVLGVFNDLNGQVHTVTMRNLRAYHSRVMKCSCGAETEIINAPLACSGCDLKPTELLSSPHHWWNQPLLENARVLMVGCGAIGNEIAKNLVLLGVNNLTIVDFDIIEEHNLSRTVLFNKYSMDDSKTMYKADVMKKSLEALNPNVIVNSIRSGVLDPISSKSGRYHSWLDDPLDDKKLVEMSIDHDICIVATDGVAPKSFLARILYSLLPMVQTAMNKNGSVAMVRSSLPLVTGCIMCPMQGDVIQFDNNGTASPYYHMMHEKTGDGGCQDFAEAMGAASFTDSNAVAGSLATSQCVNILMGWPQYRDSNFVEWPIGVPTPLWDEVHLVRPRSPELSENIKLLNIQDKFGEFVCVECSTLFQQTAARFTLLKEAGGTPIVDPDLVLQSPRMIAPEGVKKPSASRKLGQNRS
jgi:hypothetical protein